MVQEDESEENEEGPSEKVEITVDKEDTQKEKIKEIESKAKKSGQLVGRKLKEVLDATKKPNRDRTIKQTGKVVGKGVKYTKDIIQKFKEGFEEGMKHQ